MVPRSKYARIVKIPDFEGPESLINLSNLGNTYLCFSLAAARFTLGSLLCDDIQISDITFS